MRFHRPLASLIVLASLACLRARADDAPAVAGTWVLDEATAPLKSGGVTVSATNDGLRFEARLETADAKLSVAGNAPAGSGPWDVKLTGTPGAAGALAGATSAIAEVWRFKLAGARLGASWRAADGSAGGAVFRRENETPTGRIVIDPLPAGVTETRSAPFVDRAGTLRSSSRIANGQGAEVNVFRTGGLVTQVTFTSGAKGSRQFSLLDGGELAVIDWVFEKVSFNHCRFFGFPGPGPTRVTFDERGNLTVTFANGDRMVRDANTLDLAGASSDFVETKENELYQDGKRALPGIHYAGKRAVIQVVWWEYPPSGGTFDLLLGKDVVGHLASSALYQKVETGGGGYDVNRRFDRLGPALEKALAGKQDPGTRRFLAAMAR